ncbi:3-dehydroquinate synthase [Ferrimonas marina]|uniref:3-dehydroquinate synthase n=1 Tax=Ferrimonas marina TaxID=299255 RepID=A0A1M5XZL2_9GAMM|nr:3-dehydroquinate synthase [Ferrimonas marina]SHI05129.1 3-dehydroquinate synthase [Ferrimonas marina]
MEQHRILSAAQGSAATQDHCIQVQFDYRLSFTRHALAVCNPVLLNAIRRREPQRQHGVLAFVDEELARHQPQLMPQLQDYVGTHRQHLRWLAPPQTLPGGESGKTEAMVGYLHQQLNQAGADRHSVVLAIGGGAVLDTVGYAAATFHRGLRIVRLPSTVLAQNDAGIGVKNGVNAFGQKNLLGCFAPPFAVINDCDLLRTLSPRDWRAGMAEAVKVACIRDSHFFDWIEQHSSELLDRNHPAMQTLIQRCAELHLAQIRDGGDPFELGSARPLDYGHWSAHQLELQSNHRLRHGEAVAIGMALDALYAHTIGLLESDACQRLLQLLQRLGFTLNDPVLGQCDEQGQPALLAGLEAFRQHLGGQLCVTLLPRLGEGVEVNEMDLDALRQALQQLQGLD